jgi:hypothetical protein
MMCESGSALGVFRRCATALSGFCHYLRNFVFRHSLLREKMTCFGLIHFASLSTPSRNVARTQKRKPSYGEKLPND